MCCSGYSNRCSFLTFQLKHWSAVNLRWLGIKRHEPAVLIQSVSWDHYCWKLGLQPMGIIVSLPSASQSALHAHPKRPDNFSLNVLEINLLRYACFHTQVKGYAPIITSTAYKSGVSAGTASRCRVLLLVLLWKHTQVPLCHLAFLIQENICIFLSSLNIKIKGQGLLFSFVQFGSFGNCS